MIQTVEEFAEATLFERLALDRVHPILGDESISELDLRSLETQSEPPCGIYLRGTSSANGDNTLAVAITPLLFGASWKILDLFVELALNQSGAKPKRKNWTIDEKVTAAQVGLGASSLLTDDVALWRAVLCTYAATHQHRHCVVHRTAQFSSQAVQLAGADKSGSPLRPLTKTSWILSSLLLKWSPMQ